MLAMDKHKKHHTKKGAPRSAAGPRPRSSAPSRAAHGRSAAKGYKAPHRAASPHSHVAYRGSKPSADARAQAEASKAASAHSARRDGLFCPIDGRCGGCELLQVPYKKQLREKQARMEDLFADLLDADTCVHRIAGMRDPRFYRNKVVSPYVAVYDRRARKRRILCGMYERGTHRVIDSRECLIENPEAKRIILTVRELMGNFGMTPYDEDADTGFLRHVQVRVGHTSGEVMVTLITREEEFPASRAFVRALKKVHPCITTVVQNVNTRKTNVIMGDKERTLFGPGFILDSLCGLTFRISSKSFYQVNSDQTEVLYTRAVEMARLTGSETVMDAYCGTGTIGLVAARGVNGGPGAARVIGVEERPDAVADARNNAAHNGIEEAQFVAADAGAFMRDAAARGEHIDVLLMDPPRSGSTPDFLKAACLLGPRCIVYISCNPDTQLRDAEYLTGHGYRISEMQPVDMFPHTRHVENILAFERATNDDGPRRIDPADA